MRLFAKDKNGHFIREVNGIKLPFPLTWIYESEICRVCIFRNFNGDFPLLHCDKGFNWGLDFTGGVVFDTHFSQPADLEKSVAH